MRFSAPCELVTRLEISVFLGDFRFKPRIELLFGELGGPFLATCFFPLPGHFLMSWHSVITNT